MTNATGTFKVADWNEETYAERKAGKLTRADVRQDFTGDIAGGGSVVWLMCYREDGTADFVGLQDIDGTIDGRRGGFVVTSSGTFDGKEARGAWSVVAGSGRGELAGISGDGEFVAPHGGEASYRLAFEVG